MPQIEVSNSAVSSDPAPVGSSRASAAAQGVSLVICCHNGASRIADTLAHLAKQRSAGEVSAEVILVDNGSEDDTAKVAREHWPQGCLIPLRIIHEPRLGLSYARARGLSEANYELVSFVDDDNWLTDDWLATITRVMNDYPEAGACGGVAQAVCETAPPWWFDRFKSGFAIGPHLTQAADVTEDPTLLWGAGLTVRKSAWIELQARGFNFMLPDRQGKALTDGGDAELCCALRLAGWRLRFDPRLKLLHFLPKERVHWSELRARHRGGGPTSVGLDPYYFAWRRRKNSIWLRCFDRVRANWKWQVAAEAARLVTRWSPGLLLWRLHSVEGKDSVLGAEYSVSRLRKLCQMRDAYDYTVRNIGLQWNGPRTSHTIE